MLLNLSFYFLLLYFFSVYLIFPARFSLWQVQWVFYTLMGTSLVAQMVKASAYNAEDPGSIPGSGRSPGEGNGNPLLYSCLENPMDGGAWWTAVHGVTKSQTWLSNFTFTFVPLYPCQSLAQYVVDTKCSINSNKHLGLPWWLSW